MNNTESAINIFRVLETTDRRLAAQVADPSFQNREASVSPDSCSIPGPGGLLASSAWMRAAFDDLHFQILDTAAEGERVFVRLRMQGRQTGPFVQYASGKMSQIVPPTGKDIDFEQIHLLHVREGLVYRHEAVRDDITMLGQLGVFPPTPKVALAMFGWKLSGRARRAATDVSEAAAQAARI